MKSINIKGKEYIPVNERIKEFRQNDAYKGYSLETTIEQYTPDNCLCKAVIKDETGRVIATGYAAEERTASNINRTSFVENCETSAWGRALACLGIGIDASVASADELKNAVEQQEAQKQPISEMYVNAIQMKIEDVADKKGKTFKEIHDWILQKFKVEGLNQMTMGQGIDVMHLLDSRL